jgi:uncharacterized protein YndB with AHSA1/START domain
MDNLLARAAVTIDAPSDSVWEALVNPKAIQEYMFGTEVVTDWREGSPIVWKGVWQGKPFADKGVVLRVDPGRTLRYRHFSPRSGLPDRAESYHIVTIELSHEGARTRLSLTQDNNPTDQARDHSAANWRSMLAALKKYVERRPDQRDRSRAARA